MKHRLARRAVALLGAVGVIVSGMALGPAAAAGESTVSVRYRGHVQSYGWHQPGTTNGWVADGAVAGTTGESKRVEALQLAIDGPVAGGVQCSAHVQGIGWMPWVEAGASCGTSGQSRRIEAVKLRLTGDLADLYEIYYQGHVQNLGWLGWALSTTVEN